MAAIADMVRDVGAFTARVLGRDARLLERLIDDELTAAWRRTAIPVRTGALRDALTRRASKARRVDVRVRTNGSEVRVVVVHPRPDLVPEIDMQRVLQRAWARMMEGPP